MKTKVIFRKFSDGEVIAIFPEIPGSNKPDECLNYCHFGQHGSGYANPSHIKLATPEEYKELYDELTNVVGYDLQVIKRVSRIMTEKRIEELRR